MVSQEEKDIFENSAMIFAQLFIYICGVILHLLLLYAFLKDPLKCFKNLGMSFVINLAISDLLVCFTLHAISVFESRCPRLVFDLSPS